MPFAATRAHQFWSVDICYIEHHQIPDTDGPIYIITILDNYSRSIVASAPSRTQDLWAFLLILFTAIFVHGAPETLVSDGGSVLKARHALEIYDQLAIRKEQIERRKPWQDYVESHFSIMKRMEAYRLEKATNWDEFCNIHARFIADYNHQEHFAHQEQDDGKRTPAEVLSWVHGLYVPLPTLSHVFELLYGTRQIDRSGYIRYHRWRLYREEGLAGKKANVWLMKEVLTITYQDEPLVAYTVSQSKNICEFFNVSELRTLPSHHPTAPKLWDAQILAEIEWRKVIRLPRSACRRGSLGASGLVQRQIFA